MKKLILGALILSTGLLADGYTTPLNAYKANNYQKACDGGYATDCSNLEASYDESVKQDYKKPRKPRQTAGNSRDDAEIARAATNLTTAVSDIAAYFTAKGKFGTISSMTNALDGGTVKINNTVCASVSVYNISGKIFIYFTSTDPACTILQALPGIKNMCTTRDKDNRCIIEVGGSGSITF